MSKGDKSYLDLRTFVLYNPFYPHGVKMIQPASFSRLSRFSAPCLHCVLLCLTFKTVAFGVGRAFLRSEIRAGGYSFSKMPGLLPGAQMPSVLIGAETPSDFLEDAKCSPWRGAG